MNIPHVFHCAAAVRPILKRFLCVVATAIAACCALPLAATTILQPDFDGLVRQADSIVHASVKSVTSEWRIAGANKHIITKVELDVREVIAGSSPQPLVLEILGGKIGDQELRVDGAPQFTVGDEDILFIRGNGQQFVPLVAMEYGRFRVKRDPSTGHTHIARNNGTPLYSEQDVVQPMENPNAFRMSLADAQPLTPEDFKKHIRSSRQINSTRQP